jgi:hypothetical protein
LMMVCGQLSEFFRAAADSKARLLVAFTALVCAVGAMIVTVQANSTI